MLAVENRLSSLFSQGQVFFFPGFIVLTVVMLWCLDQCLIVYMFKLFGEIWLCGSRLLGTSDLQLARGNCFVNYMLLFILSQTGPSLSQPQVAWLGIQPFWGISWYSFCVLVIWRISGKKEKFRIDLKMYVIYVYVYEDTYICVHC